MTELGLPGLIFDCFSLKFVSLKNNLKWNFTTLIWQDSNSSFLSPFYLSCLDLKALLALSHLKLLPACHSQVEGSQP